MSELPNRPAWVYCQNCMSITHQTQQCEANEEQEESNHVG